MAGAILFSLVALVALARLERLQRLQRRRGVPLHPILGAGGAPFRGGLRPDSVDRVLARYPGVSTFTLQSAFKYDHPAESAAHAIETLKCAPRRPALEVDEERAVAVGDRVAARYAAEVRELAPLIRAIAPHVPRRRMRRLHIGLFGYSRSSNGEALPRAIPFVASLYAIGLPPEILGLATLEAVDREWLFAAVPCLESDLRDALAYLDAEVADLIPALRDEIALAEDLRTAPPHSGHHELAREVRARLASGEPQPLGELITRQGSIRHFLG